MEAGEWDESKELLRAEGRAKGRPCPQRIDSHLRLMDACQDSVLHETLNI